MTRRDRRPFLAVGGVLAGVAIAVVVAIGSASAGSTASPNGLPADKAARMNAQLPSKVTKVQKPTATQGRARASALAAEQGKGAAMTAGIVNLRQGPFPASVFAGNNMYRARIGATWVLAYAGAALDGQGGRQAALRVYQQQDGGKLRLIGVFPAKTVAGELTVLSAKGTTLTLGTPDGGTVAFDLATLTYV